ncbi:GNAT family N-acetyltransferase [Pseudaestuariivita atlantica]|uniref:GNAT family N-acetyltransferase n=1 Tax=Pseudaestuariivita atlantica TaxID=1317121 RepID=UPI001F5F1BF3|nr:GNAT family N-acyltransferase [Pseudaestuariivita atlantica]
MSPLVARVARDQNDILAAQRLRYQVFVKELGGSGAMVDHAAQLETDRFDPYFDHIVLVDPDKSATVGDHVVGVYRVMRLSGAVAAGQFYSEDEYDLTVLRRSGRRLLELGRSCLHPDHRGGAAMVVLWNALADYVKRHGIEVMFGVASFHGTDIAALAPALSLLHHRHLAPADLRPRARAGAYQPMDLVPPDQIDRAAAMRSVPPLIKAYLKLGGCVGDGAYIDRAFNTTDVCLVMDTAQMNAQQTNLYLRARG